MQWLVVSKSHVRNSNGDDHDVVGSGAGKEFKAQKQRVPIRVSKLRKITREDDGQHGRKMVI